MKSKLLLAISICVNAVLLAFVLRGVHSEQGRQSTPAVQGGVAKQGATLRHQAETVLSDQQELDELFHWSSIESADYRAYAENLRAVGCPEQTVRNIIKADVQELFNGRVKLMVDSVSGQFWQLLADKETFSKLVEGKEAELKQMKVERDQILEELLGSANDRSEFDQELARVERDKNYRAIFDFLPADKLEACLQLEAVLDRLSAQLPPDASREARNELAARVRQAQKEKDETYQKLFTPEEYAEYKARTSRFANLRFRLAGFEASDDEVRQMTQMLESSGSDAPGRLKSYLGDERYAAYQRSEDPGFQDIRRVSERLDLPEQNAIDAFAVRKAAELEVARVVSDLTMSQAQQADIVDAIRQETAATLAKTLGQKAFDVYMKRSGNWLDKMQTVKSQ